MTFEQKETKGTKIEKPWDEPVDGGVAGETRANARPSEQRPHLRHFQAKGNILNVGSLIEAGSF